MMAKAARVVLSVFVRQIVVHDTSDPGPGKGEFDVTFGVLAGPAGAAGESASVRWQGSVSSGKTYDVGQWMGPVAVDMERGWLSVAGGGVEMDALIDDQIRGGLTMLGHERKWGMGSWWRTTNGKHFDLVLCVTEGETEAACPVWTGDALDAPGPERPTETEFVAILPEGFDARIPAPVPTDLEVAVMAAEFGLLVPERGF